MIDSIGDDFYYFFNNLFSSFCKYSTCVIYSYFVDFIYIFSPHCCHIKIGLQL